jgi:hypothetical protein
MPAARACIEISPLPAIPAQVLSSIATSSALLLAGAGFFLTGTASRDPRGQEIIQTGRLGFGASVFAAAMITGEDSKADAVSAPEGRFRGSAG